MPVCAKDDQNPAHAGNFFVYFYDVAPTDTHGKGKLVIDLKQRTFVFNGQEDYNEPLRTS